MTEKNCLVGAFEDLLRYHNPQKVDLFWKWFKKMNFFLCCTNMKIWVSAGMSARWAFSLELSVKSGKDRASTPEFDHKQDEIPKKICNKSTLSFSVGEVGKLWKLRKAFIDCFLSFTLSFFFPDRLHCCYVYFHYSYLYSSYNSSPTFSSLYIYHQKRG